MNRATDGRLSKLEEQLAKATIIEPILNAVKQGANYSDLTPTQRDLYAQHWGYSSRKEYEQFLSQLKLFGVPCTLDEPLRLRPVFRNKQEQAEYILKSTEEIKSIIFNIKQDNE